MRGLADHRGRTVVFAWLIAVAMLLSSSSVLASVAMEKEVGADIVKQVRQSQGYVFDDYEINAVVAEIGEKLVAALGTQPFEYDFFVVNDDSINAFAIPGGKVFVHAGLIARVGSEDELAGLLGHEIAHVAAHHAIRQQQKASLANYAALLGIFAAVLNPVLGQAAIAASQTAMLSYQRDMEREADFLGVGYSEEAGFDPHAMLQLLRVIYDDQKLNPTSIPPYFLSHPLTGERMANLESRLKKLEWDGKPAAASHRLERAQAIARANAQTRRAAVPDYQRRLAQASAAERPNALEMIGILMAHGEDWALAENYLEEAEQAGRNVDRELGRTYMRRGRFDEAAVRLERAVAAQPKDWNALSDLGATEYQRGNYSKAAQYGERSLALYRYRPDVERALGRTREKLGSAGLGYYHFARAAELENRPAQALGYYMKALEQLPDEDEHRKDIAEKVKELAKKTGGAPQRPDPQARRDRGEPRAH